VHLKQGMPGDDRVRVGFVVSRAVGGAVVRNRVKRRLRAHMATWVRDLEPGSLVVVRASPAAATASWEELGTDLRTALARVRANRAGRPGERGQPRVGVDR
jgi:ribonuclease P protein component